MVSATNDRVHLGIVTVLTSLIRVVKHSKCHQWQPWLHWLEASGIISATNDRVQLAISDSLDYTHQRRQTWLVPPATRCTLLPVTALISLIRGVRHGQCHQRYVERENKRKKGKEATLYPGVEVASYGEADNTLIQLFVQSYTTPYLTGHSKSDLLQTGPTADS